jgi:DNA-binding phage protein
MADSKTYSKKEISKILTKASEIQVKKDLYEDQETLSKEDLVHIAEEVGISKEALEEALAKIGEPDLEEQTYSLTKGTSRIQNVSSVHGEITEDQWEDLVLEIRKITGGIGKINKTGNTYEWEQRKSDFGYKHFSFTPKNGQTKIQMVSSWGPFKALVGFLSFFFAFIVTLIAVKEISGKQIALMIAPLFGLGGFAMSRFFLKSYYQKQKDQLSTLASALSRKIQSFKTNSINIENDDVYSFSNDGSLDHSVKKESKS